MSQSAMVYTTAFDGFQAICNELGAFAQTLIASDSKNQRQVEEKSAELFRRFEACLGISSMGEIDCRNMLSLLYSEFTDRIVLQVGRTDTYSVPPSQEVDNYVKAAMRMAQRVTSQYTSVGHCPPSPRRLIVGAVGLQELVRELAERPLQVGQLSDAFFWLDYKFDLLHEANIGPDCVALLRAHPGLSDQISGHFQHALKAKRVACHTTEALNEMLVRYGLEPVNSSDFLYSFYNQEGPREFDWTSELYGFTVI